MIERSIDDKNFITTYDTLIYQFMEESGSKVIYFIYIQVIVNEPGMYPKLTDGKNIRALC